MGTTLAPSHGVRAPSAVIAAVLLAIASPAYAQETDPPGSSPEHTGLYLQGSAGVAYWSSDFHFDETVVPDRTVEGWGAAYGLRIDWTWTGFTFGFGIEGRTIWAEERYELSRKAWTSDGVHGVTTLGPFIDWYVYPRAGFHVGVMPGLSGFDSCQANLNICSWAGYDVPIRNHWWVGVEPRYFAGASFYGGASSKELLLTLTYN